MPSVPFFIMYSYHYVHTGGGKGGREEKGGGKERGGKQTQTQTKKKLHTICTRPTDFFSLCRQSIRQRHLHKRYAHVVHWPFYPTKLKARPNSLATNSCRSSNPSPNFFTSRRGTFISPQIKIMRGKWKNETYESCKFSDFRVCCLGALSHKTLQYIRAPATPPLPGS